MRKILRNQGDVNVLDIKLETEKFLQMLNNLPGTTTIGGTDLRTMPRSSKKQLAMQMIEAKFKKKYPLS